MNTYSFDTFDYTDNYISIPQGTLFYRGITNIPNKNIPYEIIRDVPIYLGSEIIAKEYGKIYKIASRSSMRLLDLRKIINIMPMILDNSNDYETCRLIMIAFGLVPYMFQIRLFQDFNNQMISQGRIKDNAAKNTINEKIKYMSNFKFDNIQHNPVLTRGVRIGEQYIDGKVMLILKELFKDVCDGYIAPKMLSPYHINDIAHEEIVIFDPIKNQLYVVNDDIDITISSIDERISLNNSPLVLKTHNIKIWIPKLNGGNIKEKYVDKNKFYNKKNITKKSIKEATKFVNNLNIDLKSTVRDIKATCSYYTD